MMLSSNTSEIGDYRIIKIYEARINNEADPYDAEELISKRQKVRDEINTLQTQLATAEQAVQEENSKNITE